MRTRFTTWMTPFDALMSVLVTFALLTKTLPPAVWIRTDFPFRVLAYFSMTTCELGTRPATTW
jgi:hypothetical protein